MLSRDCRHRLGSTVGGASSADRKPYGSRLQTTLPCGEVIFAFSTVPRKPRAASSKSRVSENGNALSVAACCATTGAEASFGDSLDVSIVAGWLIVGILPCAAEKQMVEKFEQRQRNCSPSNW